MAQILIGCEFSGRVHEALRARGHDAVSCDFRPTEIEGPHLQMDVPDAILFYDRDAAIFFPDCTCLTVSGLHHNKRNPDRQQKSENAIAFVETLWGSDIDLIAIENSVGCLSTQSSPGRPTQIIQPWQFGDDAGKNTCLCLKSFPGLLATKPAFPCMVMAGEYAGKLHWANQTDSGQNCLPPSEDRAKIRSTTCQGVADAIGDQRGAFLQKPETAA